MASELPERRKAEALALLALADGATLPAAAKESGFSLPRCEALAERLRRRCGAALREWREDG